MDAEDEVNTMVDNFKRDLGYTAPELYEIRFEQFRGKLQRLINEIFEDFYND